MKNVLFFFLLVGFSSCSSEKKTGELQTLDFSVELDTVKVDAGDELIYVAWNLTSSGVSADGKYFYNFRIPKPHGLEVINLETHSLEKVIPMSLDGPNALRSEYISEIITPENGNLIFSDSYQLTVFDQDLDRQKIIRLDQEKYIVDALPEGKRIWFEMSFSPDGSRMAAFYGGQNIGDPMEGIILVNFAQESARIIPLEILESWQKHVTSFIFKGSAIGGTFSMKTILLKDDMVIFGVAAENKAYFLDLKTDSVSTKTYQSQFTSPASTKSFPLQVESEEEFRQVGEEREKEVRYYGFLFDEKNEMYWRFSTESTGAPKVVLTAFSKDFDQLGELLLDDDFVYPSKVFVRDGMICTYLNQDDEVYFVRIKPEINN
jgi:hypothetical protein